MNILWVHKRAQSKAGAVFAGLTKNIILLGSWFLRLA